ncbi:BatD family protein [Candidatus Dependentiae bacterium]|nr:BatD family protein [Candidatus Dependentiae bacterium]
MKKIGNSFHFFSMLPLKIKTMFFFSFLLSSVLWSQQPLIQLIVQDEQQNSIQQIEQSIPFILQVVVDNMEVDSFPNTIRGFEYFSVMPYNQSRSTSIINGQRFDRRIFYYRLSSEKKGTYQIGPLVLKDKNGSEIQSNAVRMVVANETKVYAVKKQPFFLETKIDKKVLYVGQELLVSLCFYYQSDFDDFYITKPEFEKFIVRDTSTKPVEGTQDINGKEYHYKEWNIKLYPKETGVLVIPAIQANFKTEHDMHSGMMGGMFGFFGMNYEKTVTSTARSIEVIALPESEKYVKVTAVGSFHKAAFSMKKLQGDIGEGLVAHFSIEGEGNLEMIKAPALRLPEGLRYYESNSSINEFDKKEKTFEYIIQADRAGVFNIESQEFIYFDPQAKIYKRLATDHAFLLKVIGDDRLSVSKKDKDNALEQEKKAAVVASGLSIQESSENKLKSFIFQPGQIDRIELFASFQDSRIKTIEKLFYWLLLFFGFLVIILFGYWIYLAYFAILLQQWFWWYYVIMRIKMVEIKRNQDVFQLYQLFEQVSQRFGLNLQDQAVITLFKKSNISSENIEEWQRFLHRFLAVIFSKNDAQNQDNNLLFIQGYYWLKKLLLNCRKIN